VPAAASLAGLPTDQVRPLLAELVGAHLLAERSPGRYAAHDLLRAYAAELAYRVDDDHQRDAASHRLLEHYLHAAHAANRMLLEPHLEPIPLAPPLPGVAVLAFDGHRQAMAWFAAEHPGLLAAVDRAAGTAVGDGYVWPLAWSMTTFLNRRGQWQVQASLQRTALATAHRLGDLAGQAHGHRGVGGAYTHLGRFAEAESHLHQALATFRVVDDHIGQASAHFGLAKLFGKQGRDREAADHVRQVLDVYWATGHRPGLATALNSLGWYQAKSGEVRQAIDSCAQAIAIHQEVGNRFGEAITWDSLGYAHHRLGQYEAATACYRRALTLNGEVGDRYLDTEVLVKLGDARDASGDAAGAHDAWRRALDILRELDHGDAARVRAKLDQLARTPVAGSARRH
jgi:tetratricopeptide (TPR) repeat protein